MKVGVQVLAFREAYRIKACIEQYKPIADKIVVACSTRPWHGTLKADGTADIARSTGAIVYEQYWKNEADQRNFVMSQLEDMDFIIIAPPDRYYTREDMQNIRFFIDNEAEMGEVYGVYSLNYWKDFNTVIWPTYHLDAFLIPRRRKGGTPTKFDYANRIEDQPTQTRRVDGVLSHHISWVKTNKEMEEKIRTYSHAREIRHGWYKKYWLNWRRDMNNFGPTKPEDHKYVVDYELPREILNTFDKKWLEALNDDIRNNPKH